MSLIIAFVGGTEAAIVADMREITFQGDKVLRERLERKLYRGAIATDIELEKMAEEIGVKIKIRDNKIKVMQRYGALVGEVVSVEDGFVRKRRLYVTAGSYMIAETRDSEVKVTNKGGSAFIVLGNNITKEIANKCIRENWKNGGFHEAIKVLILSMEAAAKVSASVSKKFIIIQTSSNVNLSEVIEQDKIGRKNLPWCSSVYAFGGYD
ncbi:MAG: DUF2121 domain-containing protein [Candidatus Methanoperedens sp.]|nr:DUF2121 domain-containing protein [Candidatus Methanoperedens sp.]